MNVEFYVLIIGYLFSYGNAACTFSSSLEGTWMSSNYGNIIINSTFLTLDTLSASVGGSTSNVAFTCDRNPSSLKFVVKSVSTFTVFGGNPGNAYICYQFTYVNSNNYYFYMQSDDNHVFGNERISFWETTSSPTDSQLCSGTSLPSSAEFNSMVKSGEASSATTNCMTHILGDFTYYYGTSAGSMTDCQNDNLTVCGGDNRQSIQFNKATCAGSGMYTSDGKLGCLSVIYDSSTGGGTYYSGLYNMDSTTPNDLTTFQFLCIAATSNGTHIFVSTSQKRCTANQMSTTIASGQLYILKASVTCPFTEDSVNVLAIVLGVIFGLLFLLLLALLIYCCCKKKKKRDKIKALEQRNLKVFEKKMAMEEFDDEHPLNEASLVPDFPQNGYPVPLKLKLTPKSKRYSLPTVANVEIQTERSYTSHEQMSDRNPGSFGGPPKPFHGSNRSLATQKDFESPEYSSADHISSVTTNNKTFQQRLLNNMNNTPTKEFPTEPQYLPWPWRTANRAMRSKPASVKSGSTSFKSRNAELPDLGEFTIHNYGIKYDDTMSTANTHPPPRRPLSRASSVYNLSRPPTRMLEMKKSYSQENINRSKTSIGHFPKNSSSKSLFDRSVSHNDVSRPKPIIKPFQKSKFFEKPPSKPNNPSRRASVATIKLMMQRSNTRMLNTISESKERIPSPLRYKRKPPLPQYMRPLTRSKTLPTPSALKKAANVYGTRPETGKLKENARSMLQTKLRHKNMEQPVRRKKKYSKKKSSWKSPFSLPSSLQTRTLSLKTLSKMKHSKVEPAKSSTTIGRFNDSFTSRDFATTDHDVTSDSNGENFMDAEISHLPAIDHKPRLVSAAPRRENTYRMDKKVSEDSGISADESPTGKVAGNDDAMMFRVQEVIDKGKFKVVTPRSFPGPKKKEIPFHLPDYLK